MVSRQSWKARTLLKDISQNLSWTRPYTVIDVFGNLLSIFGLFERNGQHRQDVQEYLKKEKDIIQASILDVI